MSFALFAIVAAAIQPPVLLGTAGLFAILAKTGISTVPDSSITGDIGVSPIAGAAITGFTLTLDASNTFATSSQIVGRAFAASYTSPTPSVLGTAVGDMETAYTDAAGRAVSSGANLNILAGGISGATFSPGVYKWGSDIHFGGAIYLNGTVDDTFIFQTTGSVIVGAGAQVVLLGQSGSAPLPANIVWQVAGHVEVGAGAELQGIFLVKTHAAFGAGASLNGRLLTQTAVTLIKTTIVAPSPPLPVSPPTPPIGGN